MVELFDSLSCLTHFAHFCQFLIAFCSQLEAASDVISCRFVRLMFHDTCVKFHDPCLNRSWEIPPEAVGGGILDSFCYNFQLKVDTDVISGLAVDYVGMDVDVKFGDSRSNGSRDIRKTDFVSNEYIKVYHIRQKRLTGISQLCDCRIVSTVKWCYWYCAQNAIRFFLTSAGSI